MSVNITVLHIADCSNWALALKRVEDAARTLGEDVSVSERLISTPEEAEAWSFAGSPTVLLDGVDMFPAVDRTRDLACRLYATPSGLRGAPTIGQIQEKLDAHAR